MNRTSDEAERFYRSGKPFLQRYLPFWLANLVERMWLVLGIIVAILLPLSRIVPPLYEFRIRSRVFRWYGQLRAIELQMQVEFARRPNLWLAIARLRLRGGEHPRHEDMDRHDHRRRRSQRSRHRRARATQLGPRQRQGNREQDDGAQRVEHDALELQARGGPPLAAEHEGDRGERVWPRLPPIEEVHRERDEGRDEQRAQAVLRQRQQRQDGIEPVLHALQSIGRSVAWPCRRIRTYCFAGPCA